MAEGMKTCSRCDVLKPVQLFSKDRRLKSGLKSACKSCDSIKTKLHYEKNKARRRQTDTAWKKQNPERTKAIYNRKRRTPHGWANGTKRTNAFRARRYGQDAELVTRDDLLNLVLKSNSKCQRCGKQCPWPWEDVNGHNSEIDHIKNIQEIRAEGRNDWNSPKNLQFLCWDCHRIHKAREQEVFEESVSLGVEHALYKDQEECPGIENAPYF